MTLQARTPHTQGLALPLPLPKLLLLLLPAKTAHSMRSRRPAQKPPCMLVQHGWIMLLLMRMTQQE
jgi:hypothetical protein